MNKLISRVVVVMAFLLIATAVHAQSAGFAYMSNFQRVFPETDDTAAIRRALASIESGHTGVQ